MQALIVGADRLGNIPDLLSQWGISVRNHVSGRDKIHQRRQVRLPSGTEIVILLTDFLGHNVMQSFRTAAREQGVPVVCARRSTCSLHQALSSCPQIGASAGACSACPRNRP